MAMTSPQKTAMYRFFAIAFDAAPGVTYMNQLDAALNPPGGNGMSIKQVVNEFTTKAVFTALYPTFLDNHTFATNIVNNVVGASATNAAKLEAVADIESAMTAGWSRGDVIYQVFGNLAELIGDAKWGGTATQMANQVTVAAYYTETLLKDSTDTATLQAVIANVTQDPATVATAEAALTVVAAQTFTLTTGIDTGAAFISGAGNDTFNASGASVFGTLDNIDGGGGTNTLNVVDSAAINLAAGSVFVKNIQTANVTDASSVALDTTTWTGLTALNVLASSGADAITAAATTNVTATDSVQGTGNITITGGKAVTLIATATDGGAAVVLGDVTVGGTSTAAPVGAVDVTVTDTQTFAGATLADITVTGGVGVTVHSTVNATTAIAAHPGGGTAANTAGIITVAPTSGAVIVNSATKVIDVGTAVTVNASAISVTGGSTVNVTQTATTTQSATTVSTVAQGAVVVNGDATTTAVTVTQATASTAGAIAVTSASAALAGVSAVTAVTGAQGATAVTAVLAVPQTDAIPVSAGTPNVTVGTVTIADKNFGSTTVANTIAAVTLANYDNSTITSTALNTLTLKGPAAPEPSGGTLGITAGGSAATIAANKTLTLNLQGGKLGVVTDLSASGAGQFSTVNAVLTASTTLAGFTDPALRTLALSGTGVLTLSAANTALTSITETGAAGFNDGGLLYSMTGVTSLSGAGSTGANTVTLNPNQAFTGGSGVDTVSISANPNFAITGGGGADVLVLTAGGGYTLAKAGTLVSGFPTMSSASTTGTFDMALLPADITALKSTANSTSLAYTNVVTGTTLALTGTHTATSYTLATTGGASKAVTVALGTSTTDSVNFGTVNLLDVNGNGIGTVNLASNGMNITTGDALANSNTVILGDTGLTALNVSGTQGLIMTSQTEAVGVTGLTIGNTNTSTAGLLISDLVSGATQGLDTLTFTGTGKSVVSILHDASVAILAIANNGTGTVSITDIYSGSGGTSAPVALTNLTLTGNVALGGPDDPATTPGTSGNPVDFATGTANGAVTISGATDNAGVGIAFTAANTNAASITLGNGNNDVQLGTGVGTGLLGGGTVTTGSGMDFIFGKFSTASATTGWTINTGAGDDAIYGGLGTSTAVHNTYIGGDGADFIQLMTGAVTHSIAAATAGEYAAVAFAGSATTGTTLTNGSWTGTLYGESQDTITSTGINHAFATLMTGYIVNTAGAGKIFAGANIISDLYGQGAYAVASTAKDVFFFQTNNDVNGGDVGTGGAKLGVVNVENFKIGQDIIAVDNYQGSADNLFVGNAAAVTAINAVTPGEALLASAANGWTWALDTGSTTAGTLSYVGGIGTSPTNANMSIHLVGVQGTVVDASSFFYHA